MPAYQLTPFKQPPKLLIAGTPEYVWGSFNDKTGPTLGNVMSDSSSTVTATLTFLIISGNAPAVGDLITVVGTANGSGNLNVTNASIATVTTTDEGVCTVTYAVPSTTFSTTADGGQVIVPRPEVFESVTAPGQNSIPVCVPFAQLMANQSKTVNATVKFSGFSIATAYLQGAIFDIDSEYENLGIIAQAGSPSTGPTLEIADSAYRFYRISIQNAVGVGKVCGKITC